MVPLALEPVDQEEVELPEALRQLFPSHEVEGRAFLQEQEDPCRSLPVQAEEAPLQAVPLFVVPSEVVQLELLLEALAA